MQRLHERVPPSDTGCGEPRCGHAAGRGHPHHGWVRFYEAGPDGEAVWFCSRLCLSTWLVEVEQVLPSPVHEEDGAMDLRDAVALLKRWSGAAVTMERLCPEHVQHAANLAADRLRAEHEDDVFQAVYVPLLERAYETCIDAADKGWARYIEHGEHSASISDHDEVARDRIQAYADRMGGGVYNAAQALGYNGPNATAIIAIPGHYTDINLPHPQKESA